MTFKLLLKLGLVHGVALGQENPLRKRQKLKS